MIKIQQKKAINLKTKESIYVSFPYDMNLVAKIKSLPSRFYIPETREWEVPVAAINEVVNLFQDKEISIIGKVNTKVDKAVTSAIKIDGSIDPDFKFKTDPFKHQIDGFEYGISHRKYLLGDEQGLGKTKQGIDIAVARRLQFKHCLIICGVNGLKWNWAKEIKTHSNASYRIIGQMMNSRGEIVIGTMEDRLRDIKRDLSEFFLITNIETMRDEAIAGRIEEMCKAGIIGMVIVDEIHKAKNPTSIQGKAIHRANAFYKIAMTGTPLMNTPLDLYNVLRWIDVERHSFYQFKNHFCEMGGYGGYEVIGYKNLAELRAMVETNMLRRRKDEVLDLPEKICTYEYVEMSDKQKQIYNEIKKEIMSEIDQIKISPNPLAKLIRLRQATGFTGILSSKIKESAKLDRMEELVEEIVENGKKVIIFSNWTDITDEAAARLKKYNPAIFTGETTKTNEESKKRFQEDPNCKVIIGTIGAMGTGITLTAATYEIFLDEPWNKANKEQAEDRAHRIGTTQPVSIITLLTKGTIDERVADIVEGKGEISKMLVDGDMSKVSNGKLVDFLLS